MKPFSNFHTFKEAGYIYIKPLGNGEHVLADECGGRQEVWGKNKNHASYGLIYKNTHLEFCRGYTWQKKST